MLAGEVEVLCNKNRLGFLSEGAFFGEAAVLETHSGCEIRTRSVRSVTDCTELCFITKKDMKLLQVARDNITFITTPRTACYDC